MGEINVNGDEVTYRQADGEITAWLNDFEEKMELAHIGLPKYKRILYILVAVGVLYLGLVFLFY